MTQQLSHHPAARFGGTDHVRTGTGRLILGLVLVLAGAIVALSHEGMSLPHVIVGCATFVAGAVLAFAGWERRRQLRHGRDVGAEGLEAPATSK